MSDEQSTPDDQPFDPFKPPVPGQQPYGQPHQPPYGHPPQPGSPQGYGGPPGYGYPHSYPSAYPAPEKQSSRPLWLGAVAGLVLVGSTFAVGLSNPDLFPWLALGIALGVVIMLVAPVTRRWGLGVLIGAALSVPVGMIVLAGVCVVLIASYSGGSA